MSWLCFSRCLEGWKSLNDTSTDFLSYLTSLAFAGLSGTMARSYRLGTQCSEAELSGWRDLRKGKDVWDAANERIRLYSELGDAWVEELRNVSQIVLMTQSDMQHWSKRLINTWEGAVTGHPQRAA